MLSNAEASPRKGPCGAPWRDKSRSARDGDDPGRLRRQRSPRGHCACATYIVTYDDDLLALKKPFDIEVIRPAELLRRIG